MPYFLSRSCISASILLRTVTTEGPIFSTVSVILVWMSVEVSRSTDAVVGSGVIPWRIGAEGGDEFCDVAENTANAPANAPPNADIAATMIIKATYMNLFQDMSREFRTGVLLSISSWGGHRLRRPIPETKVT